MDTSVGVAAHECDAVNGHARLARCTDDPTNGPAGYDLAVESGDEVHGGNRHLRP